MKALVNIRSIAPLNGTDTDQHYTSGPPPPGRLLANVIYHVIMAIVTTTGNGLALFVWVKDPLKCFRTPPSFLVMSMTIANLLVSLVVEPMYSVFYYVFLVNDMELFGKAFQCYNVGLDVSTVAFNTSFLTVFIMSLDLYFALSRPLKYRVIVTRNMAFICVAVIWVYTTLFALLPRIGLPLAIYESIDLYLNTVIFFLLLLASYVALLKSFRKQRLNAMQLKPSSTLRRQCSRSPSQRVRDKKFLVAIFAQVLLVSLTVLPNMIFMMTEYYCTKCKFDKEMIIVRNILQNIMLLKFAADPFIYAWRIPRYRRALKVAVCWSRDPTAGSRMIPQHVEMRTIDN